MKNKKIFISAAVIVCVIVLCIVFFRNSDVSNKIVYVSLKEAVKSKNSFSAEYKNLKFKDNCYNQEDYENIDKLYSVNAVMNTGEEEAVKDELHKIISDIALNVMQIDISEIPYLVQNGCVEGTNNLYNYSINNTNTFYIGINGRDIAPVSGLGEINNLYRIDEGFKVEDIKSAKIDLLEQVKKLNDYNENYLSQVMIGDGFKLKSIYEFKPKQGKTEFVIRYEYTYKGISFNDAGNFATTETGFVRQNWLDYIVDEDGIACIRSFYGVKIDKVDELKDKFLSLNDACMVLSKYLAPYGEYDVENISIKYCALDYYPESDNTTHTSLKYRPMWAFLVQTGNINDYDIDPRMVMYVDMQNAKVYVIDAINNTIWFDLNSKEMKE